MEEEDEEESDDEKEMNSSEDAKFLADLKTRALKTKERFANMIVTIKRIQCGRRTRKERIFSRGCTQSETNCKRAESDKSENGGEVKGKKRRVIGNQTIGRDAFETKN